nr:uncharacterized protein LOC111099501 isoform X2 [Crassostrea virginica]XP_022286514.1 uncharacterized protein LOC111099501 isoform X2 [Crassostrea virginica]
MHSVGGCPNNLTELETRSNRLGCGNDKYGNNQYICLPNVDKTSLTELCYDGIMGMVAKGNCLEISDGSLVLRNCTSFKFGCPGEHIRNNEFYKYPACQTIDTKSRCYVLDSSCKKSDVSDEAVNDINCTVLSLLFVITLGALLMFIFFSIVFRCCRGRRQQKKNKEKVDDEKHSSTASERIPAKNPRSAASEFQMSQISKVDDHIKPEISDKSTPYPSTSLFPDVYETNRKLKSPSFGLIPHSGSDSMLLNCDDKSRKY